jgi:hypothetical protein
MDDYTFMMQQRTFETHGYALNPSTAGEEKTIFHGTYTYTPRGHSPDWKASEAAGRRALADHTGKELHDYAGRTYMHIPTDLDVKLNPSEGAPPPNTYVPERCIHTWVCSLAPGSTA